MYLTSGCAHYCASLLRQPVRGCIRWLSACMLLWLSPPLAALDLDLQLSPSHSTDGVAHLTWQTPAAAPVTLQQGTSPAFREARLLYRGSDSGTTVTGLPNGTYYFRIGADPDGSGAIRWAEPVRLEVSHHSLQRAFAFFALGLAVFLGTLGLVVFGARRQDRAP